MANNPPGGLKKEKKSLLNLKASNPRAGTNSRAHSFGGGTDSEKSVNQEMSTSQTSNNLKHRATRSSGTDTSEASIASSQNKTGFNSVDEPVRRLSRRVQLPHRTSCDVRLASSGNSDPFPKSVDLNIFETNSNQAIKGSRISKSLSTPAEMESLMSSVNSGDSEHHQCETSAEKKQTVQNFGERTQASNRTDEKLETEKKQQSLETTTVSVQTDTPIQSVQHKDEKESSNSTSCQKLERAFSDLSFAELNVLDEIEPTQGDGLSNVDKRSLFTHRIIFDDSIGPTISAPQDFRHNIKVKFDPLTQCYQGLPREWESEANRKFGVSLKVVQGVKVENYDRYIPKVLVILRDALVNSGAMELKGIFRVSADKKNVEKYLQQLEEETFQECLPNETMCLAALIKAWFRELPTKLLAPVPNKVLFKCSKEEVCDPVFEEVKTCLQEPNRSVFLWLLDMLDEVASHEESNRMSAKNLAIVFAPNLFSYGENLSPVSIIKLADAAWKVLLLCLESSIKSKKSATTQVE